MWQRIVTRLLQAFRWRQTDYLSFRFFQDILALALVFAVFHGVGLLPLPDFQSHSNKQSEWPGKLPTSWPANDTMENPQRITHLWMMFHDF